MKRGFFTLSFLVLTTIASLLLLLAGVCKFLSPKYFFPLALLGIGFEWLLLINAVFLIVWLFTDNKRYFVIPLLAIVFNIGGLRKTFSHSSGRIKGENKITVVSYNVGAFSGNRKEIIKFLRTTDADIVCLQEIVCSPKVGSLENLKSSLNYPYCYIDFKKYRTSRKYGMAVFSKYPILNKHTIQYESRTNQSDYCDVVVGKDTIRLFNNHLQSNRLTFEDIQASSEMESVQRVGLKLKDAYPLRAGQARAVAKEIKKSPYKVIVTGDFNDTPISYTYHTMSRGLSDAFLTAGGFMSLGHTFEKRGLGIRIDYILTSPQISATDFVVTKNRFSDHYPILTTLSW